MGDYFIITYPYIFYINWLQDQMFQFLFTQVYKYETCIRATLIFTHIINSSNMIVAREGLFYVRLFKMKIIYQHQKSISILSLVTCIRIFLIHIDLGQ